MTNKLNVQELYETLRQVKYRGSLTEIANRAQVSHQWVVRVLAGRVGTDSEAIVKIVNMALEVKAEYDKKIAERAATFQQLSQALAAATA